MGRTPIQPQDKYVVRFPDGLRERLKKAAEANNRSLNAEIVARLEEYHRLFPLQPRVAQLTTELEAAREALAYQKHTTQMLQQLLKENSDEAHQEADEREAAYQLIANKYDDLAEQRRLLESVKEELEKLRAERAETTPTLAQQQAEMIESLRKTEKLAQETLLQLRDASRSSPFHSGRPSVESDLVELINDLNAEIGHVEDQYLPGFADDPNPSVPPLSKPKSTLVQEIVKLIERRTELAMQIIVKELEKKGMLTLGNDTTAQLSPSQWDELMSAPKARMPEILEALAEVDIDRAFQIVRDAKRRGAA